MSPKLISAEQVQASLRYPDFVESLLGVFAAPHDMPQQQQQVLLLDPASGSHDAFAMLPSWNDDVICQKAFTYFPGNQPPARTLYSQILLFDRKTGEPLALIDGVSVTCWRTAGVSALASRFLSRPDSETLLLLGTGKLAPFLIRAHASVRPLEKILLWGRTPERMEALRKTLAGEFPAIAFECVTDLREACGMADIVVCATGSTEILVHGEWIRPGTHTDFLGNRHADKRECDSALVTRARVYVDSRENCFREAGEILVPVAEGVFSLDQVQGELADQASAALVKDLKQRGMLEDTLVIWGGEFGRTPMGQGTGRDHHIKAFSLWMAGTGIKGGHVHGATDELGYASVQDVVSVHDLHATLLDRFGIDHSRFTKKFQGLDYRLTGVEPSKVVRGIIA